jgi:hypothetical protein
MDNRATTDRTPAPNSTYPKGGVSCSKDSFVVNQTLVFQIKFCGKSPALRVAAKRYPAMGLSDNQRKYRFGLVGLFHRPASSEKLNRIEIYHVCQRPDHHFA